MASSPCAQAFSAFQTNSDWQAPYPNPREASSIRMTDVSRYISVLSQCTSFKADQAQRPRSCLDVAGSP